MEDDTSAQFADWLVTEGNEHMAGLLGLKVGGLG